MTLTQHWIEISTQVPSYNWGQHMNGRRWRELGVARGAFWDLSDATAAWRAMCWVLMQQPLGEMDIEEHWRQFVRSRIAVLRAITREGLSADAFRHPNHAANAFQKLRREGDRDQDLVDAWRTEIQRRLLQKHQQLTAWSA